MRVPNVLPLPLLLLVVVLAGAEFHIRKYAIKKCCGIFEMLSGDGQQCLWARWPRNVNLKHSMFNRIDPPFDAQWMSHWFPPGLPLNRVWDVSFRDATWPFKRALVRAVKTSIEWDERQAEAEGAAYWRSDRLAFGKDQVIRERSFFREGYDKLLAVNSYEDTGDFCVDAADPPLAPFAVITFPNCDVRDCITKCCTRGDVMEFESGRWECKEDTRKSWSPENSSVARFLHLRTPYFERQPLDWMLLIKPYYDPVECSPKGTMRVASVDESIAQLVRRRFHDSLFSSRETCTDFESLKDGTLAETVFYCYESRISRGVYWLLRPLCLVSTLLLVVSLVSVATNNRLRRKAHGWCLSCHASCLLGFNIGQVAYYVSLSDELDNFRYVPPHLSSVCKHFALPMNFLMNAANCWLTALCFNMAFGFRRLQVARPGGGSGGEWKKFFALSVMAWGLPAFITFLSAYTFKNNALSRKWYSATLVETRTCFYEIIGHVKRPLDYAAHTIHRYPGTALYHYVPAGMLVLVNAICIVYTLRKVQYLRQGNSVLYRDSNNFPQPHRQVEGMKPRAVVTPASNRAHTTVVDAKTIRLYLKMLLMTGLVELVTEVLVWATSHKINIKEFSEHFEPDVSHLDFMFMHRATGYAVDFFRAACVAWLSSPERGYFDALRRWQGGEKRGLGRAGSRRKT